MKNIKKHSTKIKKSKLSEVSKCFTIHFLHFFTHITPHQKPLPSILHRSSLSAPTTFLITLRPTPQQHHNSIFLCCNAFSNHFSSFFKLWYWNDYVPSFFHPSHTPHHSANPLMLFHLTSFLMHVSISPDVNEKGKMQKLHP